MSERKTVNASEEAQKVMTILDAFLRKEKLEYLAVDNLMYALCHAPTIIDLFKDFNLDIEEVKQELLESFKNHPKIESEVSYQPKMTVDFTEILSRSVTEENMLSVESVFVNMLMAKNNYISNYFEEHNIDLFKIQKYFTNQLHALNTNTNKIYSNNEKTGTVKKDVKYPNLEKFGTNLTVKAKNNLIDPVIGRKKEVEEIINILGQRRKNNPLLVGDAGVGKTTIAEGLALKIKEGDIPDVLKEFEIYNIEVSSLMAGAKFRGDLEERLQNIIKEASSNPNIVLFIDEIHQIIGNSNMQQGNMETANILKPALASGAIKVIGATTFKEYREIFQKHSALERRFHKIDVDEPTVEDSLSIIKGIKNKFEDFHKVSYTEKAIEAAVNLSVQFMTDKKLPDKAIDLIDMAGSRVKLTSKKAKKLVTEEDIKNIIASISKIPVGSLDGNDKDKLKNLDKKLKSAVLGQDQAIEELMKAITISRAGLSPNKNKPIGNFLFTGPTGTGKTELVKQLSKEMGIPLLRFDMSEFGSKHEVAKLVGAPPGYVGFSEGGKLTEMVKQKPHSIILLDEIEKAHPDVFNILLQVMEDGRLTDGQGRTTDFKNTILVMTSNIGASVINKKTIGFTKDMSVEKERTDAVKQSFAPEFYNRLDSVIQFKPLTQELIKKITDIHINAFMLDLIKKNVSAVFTQEAKDMISEKGFDKDYGARPLQRYLKDNVISKLSMEIICGELENGGQVIVDFKDGNFNFEMSPYTKEPELVEVKEVKRKRAKVM